MLIDHVGYVLMNNDMNYRRIGRLALPIYIFLLIEGFVHTHSRPKYLGRLALFALISEVPFDLAFRGAAFVPQHTSVMTTLALGFIAIWVLEWFYGNDGREAGTKEMPATRLQTPPFPIRLLTTFAVVLTCMVVADMLGTDYGSMGISAIVVGYILWRWEVHRVFRFAGICLVLCFGWRIELWALCALPLIALYRGRPGIRNKVLQWIFYLYYPVHLLIIHFLAIR